MNKNKFDNNHLGEAEAIIVGGKTYDAIRSYSENGCQHCDLSNTTCGMICVSTMLYCDYFKERKTPKTNKPKTNKTQTKKETQS